MLNYIDPNSSPSPIGPHHSGPTNTTTWKGSGAITGSGSKKRQKMSGEKVLGMGCEGIQKYSRIKNDQF